MPHATAFGQEPCGFGAFAKGKITGEGNRMYRVVNRLITRTHNSEQDHEQRVILFVSRYIWKYMPRNIYRAALLLYTGIRHGGASESRGIFDGRPQEDCTRGGTANVPTSQGNLSLFNCWQQGTARLA